MPAQTMDSDNAVKTVIGAEIIDMICLDLLELGLFSARNDFE